MYKLETIPFIGLDDLIDSINRICDKEKQNLVQILKLNYASDARDDNEAIVVLETRKNISLTA